MRLGELDFAYKAVNNTELHIKHTKIRIYAECLYFLVLYMQSVLIMYCFICKVYTECLGWSMAINGSHVVLVTEEVRLLALLQRHAYLAQLPSAHVIPATHQFKTGS